MIQVLEARLQGQGHLSLLSCKKQLYQTIKIMEKQAPALRGFVSRLIQHSLNQQS